MASKKHTDTAHAVETGPQVPVAAHSVDQFCKSHGISRALFYILQREKSGPRVMRVRGRTLISVEAAADWRRAMEATIGEAV